MAVRAGALLVEGRSAEQLVHCPTGRQGAKCTALRAGALLVHSDGACALIGPGTVREWTRMVLATAERFKFGKTNLFESAV